MKIGHKICSMRKKNNMTLKELAASAKISSSYLSDIEKGRSKPSVEKLLMLAKSLNTTPGYLLNEDFMMISEEKNDLMPFMANIPVLKDYEGEIDFKYADSKSGTAQTVIIDDLEQLSGLFFFRARDNSMTGSRIKKDDLVLVKKHEHASSGSVALIWLPPNELFLRRLFKEGDNIILQSDNPAFKPVIITPSDKHRIIGKALKVLFDLS